MIIEVTKKQAIAIGFDKFAPWGKNSDSWHWRGNSKCEFDLQEMTPERLDAFQKLLEDAKGTYGITPLLRNLHTYRTACDGTLFDEKVKNLVSYSVQLTEFMRRVPGHRVYSEEDGKWFGYHMTQIRYHKERRYKDGWGTWHTDPPYVDCVLQFSTDTGTSQKSKTWYTGDVVGKTVSATLVAKDLYIETDELRARYLKETSRYLKAYNAIGKQYLMTGKATYNANDTKEGKKKNDDRWWRTSTTMADAWLTDAKVVVDVRDEQEFAKQEALKNATAKPSEDDDDDESYDEDDDAGESAGESSFWRTKRVNEETNEEEDVGEPVEIPIHPYLTVFHLAKHLRMRTHIANLKKYKYDSNLIDKLVIDDMRKTLVKLLIGQSESGYRDVIATKSGGAIVMLCGAPGTGKTLTAEVFAESEKRALYSVQCAQLGVTPEDLEDELLKVLARAQRWKAVLLLDEADVYVHARGTDINQNAMVGVFLRVLEYQNAIMFMTTNRAGDIDDAVASRCTAKLEYAKPNHDELCKIWRVLADTAGAKMSDKTIQKVAQEHPDLSGRDVKQLLKLAMLVRGGKITSKTITFVKQFKSA